MSENILKNAARTLVQFPLASGGTDPASSSVDMQGFGSVRFIGILGTAGSTDVCTFAVQQSATTGSTTFAAITSATQTSTAGQSDAAFDITVTRPRLRYLRVLLTNSAAIEYGGTIALRGDEIGVSPTSNDAATSVSTGTTEVFIVPQTT